MPTTKLTAEAFEFYHSLGPDRSYGAVAKRFGVAKKTVTNRAVKDEWQTRLAERERKGRDLADAKATEGLVELNGRHLKMIRVVQQKALSALKSMPLGTAMEAVRALDMAIRQERLIVGEPTERTAMDIEAIVRREGERWLK